MIKLTRGTKPIELTNAQEIALTAEYKSTSKSVWNLDYIKKGLLAYSNDKCCYCEANIKEESKYLEVDHFHHKDKYPDEVVKWDNLLPSCKKCNGTKGAHDTVSEPIIEPTNINPKQHLKYWNYRLKSDTDLGKMTISVLNLNDQDRLIKKRFEIGNALHEKLEQLNELMNEFIDGTATHTRRKNRILKALKELMAEGLPAAIYSATSATVIATDPEYRTLKTSLEKFNLWDDDLKQLENEINTISLDLYTQ